MDGNANCEMEDANDSSDNEADVSNESSDNEADVSNESSDNEADVSNESSDNEAMDDASSNDANDSIDNEVNDVNAANDSSDRETRKRTETWARRAQKYNHRVEEVKLDVRAPDPVTRSTYGDMAPVTQSCYMTKDDLHRTVMVNPSTMHRTLVSATRIGSIDVPRRLCSMPIAIYPESRPAEADFVVVTDQGLLAVIENRPLLIDNGKQINTIK